MSLKVAAICLLMSGNILAQTSTDSITFIGNNDYQIKDSDFATAFQFNLVSYNLDAIKNLEQSITKNLPSDLKEAQEIASQRLEKVDEAQMMKLFQGTALLLQWDIKKIPAMVFGDGEYVVYGVTETKIAIKRFLDSRKR